jgi:hypothetical protein
LGLKKQDNKISLLGIISRSELCVYAGVSLVVKCQARWCLVYPLYMNVGEVAYRAQRTARTVWAINCGHVKWCGLNRCKPGNGVLSSFLSSCFIPFSFLRLLFFSLLYNWYPFSLLFAFCLHIFTFSALVKHYLHLPAVSVRAFKFCSPFWL